MSHRNKFDEIEEIRDQLGWSKERLFKVLAAATCEDEGLDGIGDENKKQATIKKQFSRENKSAPLDYYLNVLARHRDVVNKLGVRPNRLANDLEPKLNAFLAGISEKLEGKFNQEDS